jgi:hypothetical protein
LVVKLLSKGQVGPFHLSRYLLLLFVEKFVFGHIFLFN